MTKIGSNVIGFRFYFISLVKISVYLASALLVGHLHPNLYYRFRAPQTFYCVKSVLSTYFQN